MARPLSLVEDEPEEGGEEVTDTMFGDELPVDGDVEAIDAGPPPIVYDPDSDNIVFDLMATPEGAAAVKAIGREVRDNFDADRESCDEFIKRFAEDWRLFCGQLTPKNFPWEKCSNVSVPIMQENITRLWFRFHSEIFPPNEQFFDVAPVTSSPQDRQIAEYLTIHGNWQLTDNHSDFLRQMARGILMYLIAGDVVCHSYYDAFTRENRHEVLTPDEFILPYTFISTKADLSDVPRHTRILFYERHELSAREGEWYDVEKILRNFGSDHDDEPETPHRDVVAEIKGEHAPDDLSAERKILDYQGWMRLPGQDRDQWCQVYYDHLADHVYAIRVLEKDDWQDRVRFEREKMEAERYVQQTQLAQQMRMQAEQQAAVYGMAPQPVQMPQPPQWMAEGRMEPSPVRKVPVRQYTHVVFTENLSGTTGLGYGRIQADLNRAANTAQNQFNDAATLANCWTILHTDAVQFKKPLKIAPGYTNNATGVTGGELRENFIELKPSSANPQLSEMVKTYYDWGQSSAQAPAVLSGEPGKSGETFRGISARIEMATKQLSVPAGWFASQFLRRVLRQNADLNAMWLDDFELVSVVSDGRPTQVPISRRMYQRNYSTTIRSDLRFVTKSQKVMESQELFQLLQTIPPLQQNPAFIHAVLTRFLKARGDTDLIPLLGQPPPPPQQFMPPPPPMPPGPPGGPGGPPPPQ